MFSMGCISLSNYNLINFIANFFGNIIKDIQCFWILISHIILYIMVKRAKKRKTRTKTHKRNMGQTRKKKLETRRRSKNYKNKKGGFGCYKKCFPFVSDCGPGKKCSIFPRFGVSCPDPFGGTGWCVDEKSF